MMSSCKAFFLIWLTGRYLLLLCMIEIVPSFEGLVESRIFVAVLNWPRCRQTYINGITSFQSKC